MVTRRKKKVWHTPPKASFNGKHNQTKAVALIGLYMLEEMGDKSGLTVNGIYRWAGGSCNYIQCKISKWHKWGLVKCHSKIVKEKVYRLGSKGREYILEKIPPDRFNDYMNMIHEWQSKHNGNDMHMESA